VLPFEGLRREPAAPSVSPPALLPLMRLAALQSFVCDRLVGLIGSPLPLCSRRFRRSLRFPPFAVPRSLAQTGSSSRELHFLYRVLPSRTRPAPPGVRPLPWGRRSLFATSARGVLCTTEIPLSAAFPSSAFLTPLTVYATAGLVGLFHPTATSRVSLQGFDPPTQPSSARR